MLDKIKSFLARLRVRWEAFVAAMVTALPVLLDQLGVIDLKPLFEKVMSPEWASILVGLMPFVLAFLRPLIHVEEQK